MTRSKSGRLPAILSSTDAMSSSGHKRPISSHPAFRWIVSIYFALLLGLGVFALLYFRNDLFLVLRDAIGATVALPAGMTGKATVAAAAALIGWLLGLVIAMRVAALNEAAQEDDLEDELVEAEPLWLEDEAVLPEEAEDADGPRRPFNPREDIWEDGIGPLARPESAADEDPIADTAPLMVWDEETSRSESQEAVLDPAPTPLSEDAVFEAEAEIPQPQPATREDALGDLSLDALIQRLGRALAAANAQDAETAPVQDESEDDPVVAFLRREADRAAPERTESGDVDDPQAALRSALDRLSQVAKPK